jgi:hypothetical protein
MMACATRPGGRRLRLATVTIERRFRGPPESGNGGYTVGLLAKFAPEPMAVRLRVPPPLEAPLEVRAAGGGLELAAGDTIIASATPAAVELELPPPPSRADALAAASRYAGLERHAFPGCFVCGPARAAGDGLRVFAGPIGGGELLAAPWQPDPGLAGTRGAVRPEFMAAALDCPGYFAVAAQGQVMLLGSMALEIRRTVAVGEPCVVAAWSLGGGGRKWRAGTAVFGADGECAAFAVSTWVELRPGALPAGGSAG